MRGLAATEGAVEALMSRVDWSASPLGPPSDWSPTLKSAVDLLFGARAQIVLFWGPSYVAIYNDEYAPGIGDKHPRAFGRPAIENWAELWDDLEPLLDGVRKTGETFWAKDRPFYIERHGYGETSYWDVSYSWVREPGGSDGGVLCIVTDTSERVRAEEALREINDTLQDRVAAATAERDSAWRNARDMITVVSEDGIFKAVNPAVTTTLGWTAEELVGRDAFSIIHPDDHDFSRGKLAEGLGTALAPTENRILHKDGGWRLISWVTAPEGGDLFGYGRDITEERAGAEALSAAQAQLHEMQKMETLGQLTGGVAHDFNNLLTPIVGALDLLSRRLAGDEQARRLTEGGLQAAERARVLVNRLLAFSRRQHLETRPVNFCKLVAGMTEILSRSLGPRIRLENNCPDNTPSVLADPNQLELALLNLAVNARDAMPDGGALSIWAMPERIHGDASLADGDYVRVEVRDTGVGMDAETLKKAVEPFFTTKAVGKGTGLGLSSVHGLAVQSGGNFSLTSEPGCGTTATLWLPVAGVEPEDEVAGHQKPAVSPAKHDAIVLLVDDEELARSGTAQMLEEAGYAVVQANSGLEALLRVRGGLVFDVLVTDYAMADMSGVELARELRRLRPHLPILMITGYALLTDAEAEGLPRLDKPFLVDELARAVAAVLERGPSVVQSRGA